jgi:predicted ATP-grasp superfamily ATP-dependent carboligase
MSTPVLERVRRPPRRPVSTLGRDRGALVMGASYRALAVVRSLGRRGIPVCVLQSDEHSLARRSRYATYDLDLPGGTDPARRERLLDLVARHGMEGWTAIASNDEDAALLAREHAALSEHLTLTVPSWDVLRYAYDKRSMHRLAGAVGLEQPLTQFPRNDAEVGMIDGPFPLIVKPAFKAERNALTAAKAWRADDRAALLRRYREATAIMDPATLMVQEYLPGDEQLSYAALCSDGEVLASLTARRTRQFPIDFGKASTYVETIIDRSVELDARRLLEAMRFSGIVEVEFKRDQRTGANKLLDVNPRAWGWQTLCGRAGVDFPLLLWLHVNGQSLPRVESLPGVRWVRMSFDLLAVARLMRAGTLSPREYLRSLRGPIEFAIFARDDPLPAVVDGPLLLSIFAARHSRHAAF